MMDETQVKRNAGLVSNPDTVSELLARTVFLYQLIHFFQRIYISSQDIHAVYSAEFYRNRSLVGEFDKDDILHTERLLDMPNEGTRPVHLPRLAGE